MRVIKRVVRATVDGWAAFPPSGFLLVFIATALAFAEIYIHIPRGFYAPYAKYEVAASADFQRVIKVLANGLDDLFDRHNKRVRGADGDSKVPRTEVGFDILSHFRISDDMGFVGSGLTGFEIGGAVDVRDFDRGGRQKNRSAALSFSLSPSVRKQEGTTAWRWTLIQHEGEELFKKLEIDSPYINLTSEEDGFLLRFLEGVGGDPTGISGSRWRMLYFSLITITTVGFGDIVPLTDVARTLVACEAMLGILIMGLFVNAVFARRRTGAQDGRE